MSAKVFVILSISIKILNCYYLEAESNFVRPKLERTNVVNKGVWVRNKIDLMNRNHVGNFIFRPNSVDTDIQNNYYAFGNSNPVQDGPFVSSFVQRKRRSPDHKRKRYPRKSFNNGKLNKGSVDEAVIIKSKLVSNPRPTSFFNEYPYEVAILLNNEAEAVKTNAKMKLMEKIAQIKKEIDMAKLYANKTHVSNIPTKEEIKIIPLNLNITNSTASSKRTKKFDPIDDKMTKFNTIEGTEGTNNKTETEIVKDKQERNIFKKNGNIMWKQTSPLTDTNFYKVVPKEPEKTKSVTERGLIKVISMLTKTFKKIMKQHNDITNINTNLVNLNQNFDQKLIDITAKFEDFDSKYSDMIQFNNKLKSFEAELNSQKEYFDIKQKDIHNSFTEFQEQQKKFLIQQRQFYAIQKLMLAQNEKINAKQNLIAQTQSQISHRQNNFGRILKKAKQIITNNSPKLNDTTVRQQTKSTALPVTTNPTVIPLKTQPITTPLPNTESMKINLFSIPTKTSKLVNKDELIIKEKDEKEIDDLVYKYYFNNTFIDALMKSKILNNYPTHSDSVEIVNRSKLSKIKRDELETTIMLPVNNSLSDTPNKRERRWINHFSKNKYKKINKPKKETTTIPKSKESKVSDEIKLNNKGRSANEIKSTDKTSDPYLNMATNFCNEIGRNTNYQDLKWCVEKALRRLQFMEMKSFSKPPSTVAMTNEPQTNEKPTKHEELISTLNNMPTTTHIRSQPSTTMPGTKMTPVYVVATPAKDIFFPDNDELESNLKQYDLKPDTEGTVYYEGSVHISDYGRIMDDSGPTSDIMPGLMDSNSRVDIDPVTFDIQARRRAYVRRMNENIMKEMKG